MEKVVLIDGFYPHADLRAFSLMGRLKRRWEIESPYPFFQRLGRVASRVLGGKKEAVERQRQSDQVAAALAQGVRDTGTLAGPMMQAVFLQISEQWKFQPYAGEIHLIVSNTPNDKFEPDADLGWAPLVQGQIHHTLMACSHLEFFDMPHLAQLAKVLVGLMG